MSKVENITPERAKKLIDDGAVLIDVREVARIRAREHSLARATIALSQINRSHPAQEGDTVLIYHCKSGARTNMNAAKLAATSGDCHVYLLGGGIEAWKRAGLPTSRQPAGGAANSNDQGLLSKLSSLFR